VLFIVGFVYSLREFRAPVRDDYRPPFAATWRPPRRHAGRRAEMFGRASGDEPARLPGRCGELAC